LSLWSEKLVSKFAFTFTWYRYVAARINRGGESEEEDTDDEVGLHKFNPVDTIACESAAWFQHSNLKC
jgi:hypothetical protein